MKTYLNIVVSALIQLCLAGFLTIGSRCEADASNVSPTDSGIRSIILPHFEPEMPVVPGRKAFMAACVSCHSQRYITMQPRFPQHQWEETVGKMIKAYGAHLDTNQIREVVGYLVAINGVAPKEQTEDLISASSTTNLKQKVETTPLFTMAANSEDYAAEVKRGAAVFTLDCAGCHGVTGRGDGIASQALLPRPANLSATQFSAELLSQVLWNGVPGTAMPSWRDLPKIDLTGLVAYLQTLHLPVKPNNATTKTLARGKTLFLQACAACHGILGYGKSAAAATLAPVPTNLRWEQPDLDYVLQVLHDGIPGTAMPVWKNQLSESDSESLANYVRTLYAPNGTK